jgi:hypothetical protein
MRVIATVLLFGACAREADPMQVQPPAGSLDAGLAPRDTAVTPPPSSTAAGAEPEPFEGTVGIVEVRREEAVRTQTAIRAASHAGYERVVFEFDTGVPGYHIEYIDKPIRDCGAGDVKEIAGEGWLEVRLYPARSHDDAGRPTLPARELEPRLAVVRELERTCDFEAVVTWVIGAASPNRFRVLELSGPPRLVVDIAKGS